MQWLNNYEELGKNKYSIKAHRRLSKWHLEKNI